MTNDKLLTNIIISEVGWVSVLGRWGVWSEWNDVDGREKNLLYHTRSKKTGDKRHFSSFHILPFLCTIESYVVVCTLLFSFVEPPPPALSRMGKSILFVSASSLFLFFLLLL